MFVTIHPIPAGSLVGNMHCALEVHYAATSNIGCLDTNIGQPIFWCKKHSDRLKVGRCLKNRYLPPRQYGSCSERNLSVHGHLVYGKLPFLGIQAAIALVPLKKFSRKNEFK